MSTICSLVPRPSSLVGKNKGEDFLSSGKGSTTREDGLGTRLDYNNYPARACASKGLCDRSWRLYSVVVYCIFVYKSALFFGTNLLSPKILTLRCLF